MKLSVSIPDHDVAALDAYIASHGLASRSAAVQRAVRALRTEDLGDDYETAFAEWDALPDGALWDATAGDGLSDAAR